LYGCIELKSHIVWSQATDRIYSVLLCYPQYQDRDESVMNYPLKSQAINNMLTSANAKSNVSL